MRETPKQQNSTHRCNYDPRVRGDHVLIVDDDERMLGFCKNAFSLFLNYDQEKILTAGSVNEAFDVLKQTKIGGKHLGLIISDIAMPHRNGFDLVNELYYRNFDLEILLMKDETEEIIAPADYAGEIEVLEGQPFVSGILTKPFHSNKLVDAVRRLQFAGFLR